MALNMPGDIKNHLQELIIILQEKTKDFTPPAIDQIVAQYGRDPFLILISCLLSLRTRDTTSIIVSRNLFSRAQTPAEILAIPTQELETLFHPIGFFRAKARIIQSVSKEILEKFSGQVPQTEQELRSIKGIGQKTANAVLGYAFNIPAICVDTHVHQIANRLGLVKTKTADQTEQALKGIIPQQYWIRLNYLLVLWGQNICTPTSPFCSKCAIANLCPKINIKKSR